MTLRSALLLAALSALALPAAGLAQIPGGDPNDVFDRRDAARAEVRARTLREVSERLTEWADAWLEDDVDELMDRYAYHALSEDGSGSMQRGTVMMAFLKEDGWKILSQLFVPEAAAESGGQG